MVAGGSTANDPSVPTEKGQGPTVLRHDFAFQLIVPRSWHNEYSQNATIKAGQVIYSTPGGNFVFVSFGALADVAARFQTLERYRDASIGSIQSQGGISGSASHQGELSICGHKALLSNLRGRTPAGASAEIWSMDLWCDVAGRYYSVYGDFSHPGEFPDAQSAFVSIAKSLVCHGTEGAQTAWEWADMGFDTKSKVWFLQLFNFSGLTEVYQSKEIVLTGGSAAQYQWPERGARPMWHIRERFYSSQVERIGYREDGAVLVHGREAAGPDRQLPEAFSSITYAYSIATSRGFVEFRDGNNNTIRKIEDIWIVVEDLPRKTIGTFPNIRLTANKEDIERVLIGETCIIIQGKRPSR